jgi:hypothetical protein
MYQLVYSTNAENYALIDSINNDNAFNFKLKKARRKRLRSTNKFDKIEKSRISKLVPNYRDYIKVTSYKKMKEIIETHRFYSQKLKPTVRVCQEFLHFIGFNEILLEPRYRSNSEEIILSVKAYGL